MWGKEPPHSRLVELQAGAVTLKISAENFQNTKNRSIK